MHFPRETALGALSCQDGDQTVDGRRPESAFRQATEARAAATSTHARRIGSMSASFAMSSKVAVSPGPAVVSQVCMAGRSRIIRMTSGFTSTAGVCHLRLRTVVALEAGRSGVVGVREVRLAMQALEEICRRVAVRVQVLQELVIDPVEPQRLERVRQRLEFVVPNAT